MLPPDPRKHVRVLFRYLVNPIYLALAWARLARLGYLL